MVHDKNKAKSNKTTDICAQLCGTMGASDTRLIDKDEDDENEDVYVSDRYAPRYEVHIDLQFVPRK